MLEKLQDIIYINVPDGLPPIRIVSHCIDLISGASFHNRAPHRLTLDEKVELNQQMQELL